MQLQEFKKSEQFNKMDALVQNMVMGAMSDLKIEFLMTLPSEIKEHSGLFEKVDPRTVRLQFSGNFLEDPTILESLYGMSGPESKVVWASGTSRSAQKKTPNEVKTAIAETKVPEKANDIDTKVYLNNGTQAEGKLLEKTEEYIKLSVSDVAVTFYNDEIKRIENLK